MQKVKDTIKNAASYSSGNALKLFSQCAEIQVKLRANFYDVTFVSSFANVAPPQGSKCQSLSQL